MKRSKRYKEAAAKIEAGKLYGLREAVELFKSIATAKFNELIHKHYPNKSNEHALSLTVYSGKSKGKIEGLRHLSKKSNSKSNNFPIKLFSTENNNKYKDNNCIETKMNLQKLEHNREKNNNNKKCKKKFNSLLSTILNYDKIMIKSKYYNKNNIIIKK